MIAIVIVCVVVLAAVMVFNKLVRLRMLIREAESGVDVQLKRRHDLVPNIIETVKGYMSYERDVLTRVTMLRSQAETAGPQEDKLKLENELAFGLRSIFALVENYPDLKSNRSFLELQNTMIEVEDQLQMARRYFNGTVRDYNIIVESFPSNILAYIFGFKRKDFFEIEYATQRAVPDVKF